MKRKGEKEEKGRKRREREKKKRKGEKEEKKRLAVEFVSLGNPSRYRCGVCVSTLKKGTDNDMMIFRKKSLNFQACVRPADLVDEEMRRLTCAPNVSVVLNFSSQTPFFLKRE